MAFRLADIFDLEVAMDMEWRLVVKGVEVCLHIMG